MSFLPSAIPLAGSILLVPTVGDLPPATVKGQVRITADTGTLYVSDGTTWNSAGGGGSGVASVNGLTGVVLLQAGDGSILSTDQNILLYANSANEVTNLNGWNIDSTTSALNRNLTVNPDDLNGKTFDNYYLGFAPLQNSPDEFWNAENYYYDIDPTSTGFSFGTSGNAVTHQAITFNAQGTGNLGAVTFASQNFSIGNGTDAFQFKGVSYAYGFGQINNNITLVGPMQGYGYQWTMGASAATDITNVYSNAFYDSCNVGCEWGGSWTTFSSTPTLAAIKTNNNYTGINISPLVTQLQGNAGVYGLAISPAIAGYTGTQTQFQGISINPQTSSVHSAQGIYASLDNVTVYAGAIASVVIQDLTFAANAAGSAGNGASITYTGGGTAGAEVVTNVGLAFSCQIEDGVSTASQIKAAFDAYGQYATVANVTISGSGSNPQTIQGPTSLAGGADPGFKKVAYLDGDVEITGSLTFGGALSIGILNAFGQKVLSDGGGSPQTVNSLVSSMTAAANLTINNVDTIGLNTAALIDIGDNTVLTSSFLGIASLALPAVVKLGASASLDRCSGATFALSLDGTSGAGSSIDTLDLCRSVAIPNGVTAVNKLRGFTMDLPFGDPGTLTHGVYISPTSAHNYFASDVVVGTSDTPTNSSCGIELISTTKAIRLSNMDTAARNAMTALPGMMIFNTDTNALQIFNGTIWV